MTWFAELTLDRFLLEFWRILLELSPSLLLGLLIAGILHVFLPRNLIKRRLSKPGLKGVFEAVLIGVPMPLCSCGVIPTAMGLRKDGASRGAVTGFLISTPQTGVDSILVSATFLGWPFALFKVIAAFVTGMIGGTLANALDKKNVRDENADWKPEEEDTPSKNRLVEVFRYGIFELLGSIDLWIVIGLVASVLITILIPPGSLSQFSWIGGLGGMLLVLLIALPMYVCTTGSVPIAASLITAGMPVGTALVFLMAGPASNVATIGAVYRVLGGKVLAVYLGTVATFSMLLGLFFDFVIIEVFLSAPVTPSCHVETNWISLLSATLVSGLLVFLLGRRLIRRLASMTRKSPMDTEKGCQLTVVGMSCQHCVASVKRALESVPGVESATPDLSSGHVLVKGENLEADALKTAVEKAGYHVK